MTIAETVAAHTRPVPALARIALELRASQDPVAMAEQIEAALRPLRARVAPLSALEPGVLVAEFGARAFDSDEAAFATAYALADEFDLPAAEPDLATAYFPEPTTPPPPPVGDAADVRESIRSFPPGCWVPAEPELDERPRWALDVMQVPAAWALSEARQRPSRGRGIVIAQPDTGVTAHAELDGVVTVPGRDVLSRDDDPTEPPDITGNPGHGTATASVVVSPQSLVVAGTAPLASHMAIRAIESVIRVSQVSVARSIDWATEHGAHVITMSLGGIPSFSLHRALRRAVQADVIVLAAAGNCARLVVWPARFGDCIAVAGTDSRNQPWPGTCRGDAVDIAAPAQNVLRAGLDAQGRAGDEVSQGQGTSFAVALTAGVAALWLAHHGRANLIAAARANGETLQAMFRRLARATATVPSSWDASQFGAGVVDARALLEADPALAGDAVPESMPIASDARAAESASVASLVAESAGREVAAEAAVDWHRFGPEIGNAVLRRRMAQLAGEADVGGRLRPEAAAADAALRSGAGAAAPVTAELAAATDDPALRDALGLDDLSRPAPDRPGDPTPEPR